jgi:hypothetical protein
VRLILAFAFSTFWCASVASADGICIPPPIKSSMVSGTVYFGSESRPLSDVKIEVLPYAYGPSAVASAISRADGSFSITTVKPGRYRLNAKHAVVGHLEVEARIGSSWFRARHTRIVIVIGADPSKGPCWGGYAKVRSSDDISRVRQAVFHAISKRVSRATIFRLSRWTSVAV